MAHPEESQRALKSSTAAGKSALALGAAVLAVCVIAYVIVTVPGAWFPSATPIAFNARDMRVVEGTAALANDELVVSSLSPGTRLALVSVATDFRARDYPAVAWSATDLDDNAQVQMVWRTDYAPAKLHSIKVPVSAGRALTLTLAGDPNWVGRITGVALSIRGSLPQPARIRGVTAKPMGVAGVVADRWSEWVAFERFSGASINTITGGAETQQLPLPLLLAVVIVISAGVWFAWFVRKRATASLPIVVAVLFVAAWALLDARWMWNLAQQVRETAALYAGKDWHERSLAAEDGPLFAFIEKARTLLPAAPARVFMFADADYFRGRGAYHLYPHNVYFDPWRNALPPPQMLHAGDYVIVYQRRGIQYNPSEKHLRWDDGAPLNAELLLADRGSALFRIL